MKILFKQLNFFLRAALIVLVTVYDSIALILSTLLLGTKYNFFRHYKNWAGRVLTLSGVKISLKGTENLSEGNTYIYISNHSSLYDIPVIFSALDDHVRIMYKKELEKVPVFGYGLKKSPFIAVKREEPRNAMKSIEEALQLIRQNTSVIIFPEGSRSKDGKLGTFKRGAFLLASRSGKPIVPIAIIGTPEIIKTGKFYFDRREIKVIIGKPVNQPENPTKEEELGLIRRIHDEIEENLQSGK